VIAAPGFRARPIQQHQLTFQVAVDSAAGGVVARRLALGAFTLTGTVRVDGIAPFARDTDRPGYSDSARFESDGRVMLVVADSAARGPIVVEPRGIAGANAGRLLLSATGWPANRVLVVTLEPLDLFVTESRRGYGTRDRVRIDDVRGVAYVSDSAAPPAVIAIGMGRGARGRVQTELTDIVLERDYGGATGRERRSVNRLVMIVEPDRNDAGDMRAEILFGMGRSEAEAWTAAQSGGLDVPAAAALPRITTPDPSVALALAHLVGAAAWTGSAPAVAADTALGGAELWRRITSDARQLINRDYGRSDSVAPDAARFRSRVLHGLFGIEEASDRIRIAPRLDGAADDFTWRIEGWRLGSDTLSLRYRPADRRASLVVGALRRVRLEFRFPWLDAASCVTARRGPDAPERLGLVMTSDGSGYVDLRAAFEPAVVSIAAGC
jgi:hypothetical protein